MNLGAAPQPVIEGTPAEVALNPEASGDGNPARTPCQRAERVNGGDNEGGSAAPWAQAAPRRAQPAGPSITTTQASTSRGLAQTLARGVALTSAAEPAAEESGNHRAALIDADN